MSLIMLQLMMGFCRDNQLSRLNLQPDKVYVDANALLIHVVQNIREDELAVLKINHAEQVVDWKVKQDLYDM